ncbi:MAG: chromosome segregation protein SMC [Cytophagaceae bacterium]
MAEIKENQKSGSKKGLIIAFIVILLAINAVQLFLGLQKNDQIAEKNTKIEEQQAKIDSTTTELDKAISELKLKQEEIARLGGDVTVLSEQIKGLEGERDKYKNDSRNYYNKYQDLKSKIDEALRYREQAQAEVERLRADLAKAETNLKEYQSQVAVRDDSINHLISLKQELDKKVALASVLKAENIQLASVSSKGKEKAGTEFKAKGTEKLKVTFNLADNKVAKQEGKDIILRIIEPDGAALFDVASGGGSVNTDGREMFYTQKQTILFDNKKQNITFLYSKGGNYKPGKHTVEIYSEGFKIGEATFNVK